MYQLSDEYLPTCLVNDSSEFITLLDKEGNVVYTNPYINNIFNKNSVRLAKETEINKKENNESELNGFIITEFSSNDSRIIYANNDCCQLFNLSAEELTGKNYFDILAFFNADNSWHETLLNHINNKKEYQQKILFRFADGKSLWFGLKAFPLINNYNNKKISHFITTYTVINEKNIKPVDEEKFNELNTFVYKATHDLKGPLASITGLCTMGLNLGNEPQTNKLFEMIRESTSRLDMLLNELLFLSKLEHGGQKFEILDIPEIINQIIESYRYSVAFNNVKVTFNYERKSKITADYITVNSIIQNIIDNAIKYKNYGLPETEIKINTIDQENGILISIEDNGVGIPKEHLNKIFEMFYRANNFSKGTGLGLYIVKKSLEKIGGNINVESEEGKGSKFVIYLPDKK